MGIKLVTFAAQTATPQDDALIYETALQESGMIYGGVVTIKNANVLHVDAGHGALCGRKFTIEATDVPVPLTASGSLQGRIYIHMDLSDTGEPISFQVETASSLTPVIQQADVNINSGIYEINLATFIVDTSTISNLVNVAPFIDIEPDAEFNAQSNNPVQNKVITKAVGVPETIGGLASQEYNIGDTLVATDGQFYDVIAHISPNATIVLNGNVTLGGNIVDLINSLSSQISNLANRYSVAGYTQGVNLAICDGISNWNAYLNTARNSYASWIANIDSKQLVHLDRLRLGSITIPNLSSMLFAKGQGIGTGGGAIFSYPYINGGKICMFEAIALAHYYEYNGSTFIDHGSEIPASGTVIAIDVTYYQKDM